MLCVKAASENHDTVEAAPATIELRLLKSNVAFPEPIEFSHNAAALSKARGSGAVRTIIGQHNSAGQLDVAVAAV